MYRNYNSSQSGFIDVKITIYVSKISLFMEKVMHF